MNHPEPYLWIDGQRITTTDHGDLEVRNPADGSLLGRLPIAGPEHLEAAAAAAQRGFEIWRRTLPHERYQVLRRATQLLRERAPTLAAWITREQGKPLAESLREVQLSADIIDFLAEEGKRLASRGVPPRLANVISQTVTRVPVGPVLALTPWNFPVNLPARKLGAALAAGCSVVLKPDEATPTATLGLVQCLTDAGLPPGVLNVVFGVPATISSTLIADPRIAKVSFTGSTRVGAQLAALAGQHLKRFTAELGGHAPVIVCADADPLAVAQLAVAAKFRGAGQVCASPVRFLVDRAIYPAFRDAFVQAAQQLQVGPGDQAGVQMGPLQAPRRVAAMCELVADARAQGARLLCGGGPLETIAGGQGYFFAPTVLEGAPANCRVQTEEPFGPIALLDRFDELDEALQRANALPYGLAAYAFTHDLNTAARLSNELRAGMVGINHFGVSQPETPFGGVGASGMGSESGLEGLLAYTEVKLVSLAIAPGAPR